MDIFARWYNELNEFKWPDDLPGKPVNFDSLPVSFALDDPRRKLEKNKSEAVSPVMWVIKKVIGEKACLEYHHLHNLGRTSKEFEDWWNKRGLDNP